MRISLLAILVVYSHVMVGQNIDYNISPIKCVFNNLYLRDIPIHITIDYSTDGQRHLFLYQIVVLLMMTRKNGMCMI